MDSSDIETGRYRLRRSIVLWQIVKIWVRIAATYLSFTALTEKNARIDTAQQQQIFSMTDISNYPQTLTAIDRMDRDLMIRFFFTHYVPPNLSKLLMSDNQSLLIFSRQLYFAATQSENHLFKVSRVPWLMFRKASS